MTRNLMIAYAIGVGIIALLVTGVMLMQRGSAINIDVKFLKVRTAPLDENSTVAAIDLRVANPSNLLEEVRQVQVEMVDASGNTVNGEVISEGDTKRVFEAVPILGQKFLETLSMRQRLTAHSTRDYMVAARFAVPVDKVDARHRLVLHVEEVDGKTFDFPER